MMRWPFRRCEALFGAIVCSACAAAQPATVSIPEPPGATAVAPPPAAPNEAKAKSVEPEGGEDEEGDTRMSSWVGSSRGWLGVELEATGTDEAGVRVLRVVPKSPAEGAGVEAGDIIVRIDNEAVGVPADLVELVSRHPAGARVSLMVKRSRQDRLVGVTLGAFPEGDALLRMTFVGQPAPPFEQLEPAQGSAAPTLLAQRGKVVVVEFWAPWCVACRALIPHMNQWHAQYAARGLNVLGVTNEPVERAALSAKQLGMQYPILADPSGQTTRGYGARAIPMVLLIDRQGTVRDVMVGYDGQKLAELDTLVERLIAEP